MQASRKENNHIIVDGDIKTNEDNRILKELLNEVADEGAKSVEVDLENSSFLTSAIIGHLVMMKDKRQVDIRINYNDPRVGELLETLGMNKKIKGSLKS